MAVHILTHHIGQDKQEVRIFNSIVHMFGITHNVYAYIVGGMLIDSAIRIFGYLPSERGYTFLSFGFLGA
ncbi:hypothetical protein [Desulfosporosinus shakirovi]|uniref:hypothetical protein n=1 Tax=Desulfosporosinus shakirovi TaxID=2885154 RepID=UPI001E636E0D|nr:hypothetical protein [Desulfosporosinus sp. SRJS8]MCB8815857.1 hypothetical protein [Desulfosporosinus sp. SRJS8]